MVKKKKKVQVSQGPCFTQTKRRRADLRRENQMSLKLQELEKQHGRNAYKKINSHRYTEVLRRKLRLPTD